MMLDFRWPARALALALTLSIGLGAALTARAQHRPGEASIGTPDVPSGPATIRGRVVHPTRSDAAAGLEIALYALHAGGMPGLRRGTTGADGSFAFEGVANDASITYLVGARYGEVPFPGERVQFAPGELVREVEIRIADATRDPGAVSVSESRLRFERTAEGLAVTETHRLHNAGPNVVFAAKAERESGARAAFRSALPDGARKLSHPLGLTPEGLALEGNDLAFFGPIYPGDQELAFSYELPIAPGSSVLRKRFPSGAQRVIVLAPKTGLSLRAGALTPGGDVTDDGRPYASFEAKGLAAGAAVALDLDVPPTRDDPNALRIEEARIFVELDDAVLLAREEYTVRVEGDTPVLGRSDLPLLVIPLPPGAEELRFATETGGLGLAPDPRGLAVLGPIAPGEAQIDVMYRMPITAGAVGFDRSFAKSVPLLSIFLADTGLVPESERLHRRRPVRGEDRAYVHLEAFDVEPGENVPLRIVPRPRGGGVPNGLAIALVLAAAAAAAAYLSGPLLRAGAARPMEDELPATRREREEIYVSLRDLEDDFATGKLSEADYAGMRADLRARAVQLLQEERDAALAPARPAAVRPTPYCVECGRTARPDDRFCGRCGKRLHDEPSGAPA
jgi:hypothetical protein